MTMELHTFEYMSRFLPYHSYCKIGKTMGTLGKFSTYRKVFKLCVNIKIKSLDPFRANNISIRKAEDGPYLGFSYKSLISDPIRPGKRSQRKIL